MVLGKVVVTPSIVTNGEELILKIEGNASASGEATVNGKKYYPVVHYLVDGKRWQHRLKLPCLLMQSA